jgi:exodeoxyribonuclease VII small subunit
MANEKFKYGDAINEIEKILESIENEELDVDDLTEKVKRVAQLIKLCKKKLTHTEQAVEKILEEMQDE